MATITETIKGIYQTTLTKKEMKLPPAPAPSLKSEVCPPDCPCRNYTKNKYSVTSQVLFNGLGIIVALLATYLLITTDSKLYLIFWIFYSVLRRMITRSKLSTRKVNFKSD